ncbi:MAG: hypothetical protein WCX90_00010 [Thiohalomonadaceae bacterium]
MADIGPTPILPPSPVIRPHSVPGEADRQPRQQPPKKYEPPLPQEEEPTEDESAPDENNDGDKPHIDVYV